MIDVANQYTDEEGVFLVKLARRTIDTYLRTGSKLSVPTDTPEKLREKSGVFVTLNTIRSGKVELRGCIGRPYPSQPLGEATIDSAIDSAVNDPRFSPVRPDELDSILVELSVLTPPKRLDYDDPDELLSLIKIGRDGLIAIRGQMRGLLLPQVPVEWGWDVKEFLEHTCSKAWLHKDAWRDLKTEFWAFQAEIFGEIEPNGRIVRNPVHARC